MTAAHRGAGGDARPRVPGRRAPAAFRSLTLRLTLLFALASTVVLALIGYFFASSLDVHFVHEDAMELRGKTELVRHLLGRLHSDADLETLNERLQDALVGHETLFVSIRDPSGKLLFASPGELFPLDQLRRAPVLSVEHGLDIGSGRIAGHYYRFTRVAIPTDHPALRQLDLTVAMNIDHHEEFIDAVRRSVWIAVVAGALLSGVLGWLVARLGLAPVRELARLTTRISAHRLNARVGTERLPPELADLGASFNDMLSRLEEAFQRLSDFSSDLAHELRTPISNLLTEAQVALSRSRSVDEYREVIYSAMEEYERLARMIADMLFLAKADNGLMVAAREPVELRAETEALFEFYDALCDEQGVRLRVQGAVTVPGDRIMIRRALSNLLSNAIRHTPRGGEIDVAIRTEGADALLTIANPGSPIAPEHLPRLFNRFYRVDPARQRSTEGAGLGLAITKTIVDSHGGSIAVTSDSRGTCFRVRLPRAETSPPQGTAVQEGTSAQQA